MQLAMLLKLLDVIGPLLPVHHHVTAVVGAVKKLAVLIEIETPGIAAAFAEKLEFVGDGMVPPHALFKVDAADMGRQVGSLCAVQPAIRAPRQRIGQRACVFHAEARKEHLGVAVGDVVMVAVGVKRR